MGYLLDTNVISEYARPRPSALVVAWGDGISRDDAFTSVMVIGELSRGAEKLRDMHQRERLRQWIKGDVVDRFGPRILPVTTDVANLWGRLMAEGRTRPVIDGLIAATALHHNLTLVTRNVADYGYPGLTVLNPWEPGTTP